MISSRGRIGCWCFVFLICLFALVTTAPFVSANNAFSNYIAVSNKRQLYDVRNNLSGHYYLTTDIVFSPADFAPNGDFYNGGLGWEPIGTSGRAPFSGVLDGNGHAIKGMIINNTSGSLRYAGLIGYNLGIVRNVYMEDCRIKVGGSDYAYAGGLAGASNGTISNCYSNSMVEIESCSISGSAGGIVGSVQAGFVSACLNQGNVTAKGATLNTGGIAGFSNGSLSQCGNTGNITSDGTGNVYSGGIVGQNQKQVFDIYNSGNIEVTAHCDGFSGGIAGENHGFIQRGVNTGKIKVLITSKEYIGAVAGSNTNGTFIHCYYLSANGNPPSSNGSSKATELTVLQLADKSSFSGFDFTQIWTIENAFPALRNTPKARQTNGSNANASGNSATTPSKTMGTSGTTRLPLTNPTTMNRSSRDIGGRAQNTESAASSSSGIGTNGTNAANGGPPSSTAPVSSEKEGLPKTWVLFLIPFLFLLLLTTVIIMLNRNRKNGKQI